MTTRKTIPLDLAAARERLAGGGEKFWRGLDELAQSEAFQEMLHREFPDEASEWADPVSRRRFLALAGASLALAGLSGCAQQAPPEKIVPYVKQPEQMVLGKPLFFATAMALGGTAIGLLVESHEGRPTKVEGNPSHPASLGATDVFAQAAILGLYDPDRSAEVTYLGRPRGWEAAALEIRKLLAAQRGRKGAGLRLLTGTIASPTLADQMERLLKEYPEAKWVQYDPLAAENEAEGSRLAFGREVNTYYDLEKADVIVSLDADFLSCGQGGAHLRYSRQYAARRKVWQEKAPEMNRLYVVEGTPSVTGSVADHHIRVRTGLVGSFARALAAELHKGIEGDTALADIAAGPDLPEEAAKAVGPIARDLLAHRGRCVVMAGYAQPPAVHALAHAMNQPLRNVGQTVFHTDPIIPPPADADVAKRSTRGPAGLRELVADMNGGAVEALFILGANPVYTAPADIDFRSALEGLSRRKAMTVHHGLYQDESAEFCQWHVPETHFLEAWGDARSFNGVASVMQPLIGPLFGGRSAHDLLEAFMQGTQRPGYEIVRAYWAAHRPKGDGNFEEFWRQSLNDGVIKGTELPVKPATLQSGWSAKNLPAVRAEAATPDNMEIVFRPDPTLYDGRFANNGWLQELPRPLSRLTWDNAAFVSPKTAEKLGVASDIKLGWHGGEHGKAFAPIVEVRSGSASERFPVWVMPGHADDAVTLHLGGGRTRAGKVGNTDGRFNAYKLRTADLPWWGGGGRVNKTGEEFTLACIQYHHGITDPAEKQYKERHIVRHAKYEEYKEHPDFARHEAAEAKEHSTHPNPERLLPNVKEEDRPKIGRMPLTLYGDEWKYPRYKWGMAIDLSSCTGCSACVIACQAENNIPVVGKEQVTRGREMHWLRVDRYYAGDSVDNPQTFHQPVPCMQCENAPCELVCPVEATAHSHDGLNDMVYNRCVGTRYCSNNCPYKVRRFNFLYYNRERFLVPTLKMLSNPDVTVRTRGVMEKCTYCVQRIREAEIEAEKRGVRTGKDGRIRDGEVVTACQAVCPAGAIVFGDINDENSRVRKMKATPLDYGILADLNTRPRTTYLAAVRNPNPEMAK
jgi:molybdopterin-containing oxidoreductase family iron-sulfur binding subunit